MSSALKRKNYVEVAEIFHLAESGVFECYTSASTFFTIAFFLRKNRNAKGIFKLYFSFINIITTSEENLQTAVNSSFNDIEDAFHYYSAIAQCDAFITFNKKDFVRHSNRNLPCFSPLEFLKAIRS